jgi:two-component system, OmpR family, copper resistance phosphate regulon response regulator CusR
MILPRKRILCIEDEDNGLLLKKLLSDNYEVTTASTLAEGRRLAQERVFDLILLEGWLPDGVGFDLCRQIRELNPQIPILFYSSLAYEADRQRGLSAGAQVYLIMPNDLERLLPTITRLIIESVGSNSLVVEQCVSR